ncbi:MAG: glycosyltransferase family 2 protein [Microgenomates group bacterium]|nr:glycosyltransferase family 2 protein [Microgenomates group bacterium]
MNKLSVIVLSYNTKKITQNCLNHLLKVFEQNKHLDKEIIIVDNASQDGSKNMIRELAKKNSFIKTIYNKKNLGYSKANNQGARLASGNYLLFLNSDIIINQLDFQELINFLDQHSDVGALTVKIVLSNGQLDPASHRGFPTLWRSFCYFSGLEKFFGNWPFLNRLFGGYHLKHLNIDQSHPIDSPSGAFYLIKKNVFDKVGGFDEDFFMYGEDLDLSYRIKKLGFKIFYYPKFQVVHLKYASGLKRNGQEKARTKRNFYQAMKIFYQKHYHQRNCFLVNKIVYALIEFKIKKYEKNWH